MTDQEREAAEAGPPGRDRPIAPGEGLGPKHLSLGIADFVETESVAGAEPTAPGRAVGAGAASPASESLARESPLSATRERLLREETHPHMVVVRVLEDVKWVQGRLRKEVTEADGTPARVSVLKLYWAIRTEAVKVLQDLGAIPRELFFTDEESDFDHLPTEVAETVAGLLAGRLEPKSAADSDHAA
jgi:hypothetical protein